MTTTETLRHTRDHMLADVAEIVAASDATISPRVNAWHGYDFALAWGTSSIRDGARVVMDDEDVVVYLFTGHGVSAETRFGGACSAELVAFVVLQYLASLTTQE